MQEKGECYMEKAKAYLVGLVFSFLAVIVFAAFEWIKVGVGHEKIQTLAIIATLFWTIMFLAAVVVWAFLALLGSMTAGFGALFGMGLVAYVLVKVAVYLLPPGLATFSQDEMHLFVIGMYYCLSAVIFRTRIKTKQKIKKEKEPAGSPA